jgi:hypothetical protein
VAERVTCADCGAVAAEDSQRCDACGSRRLQGPPDVYARPWVLGGIVALAALVVVLLTVLALLVPVGILADAGLKLPGEGDRRVRSLDRQWDLIREAERSVPIFPGSSRVKEVHGTIAGGAARTLAVCWAAPADFEAVRRYFVAFLQEREHGWQALSGGSRVYRKGRVYLAVTAPQVGNPPCDGTYQLNFSYQV